MKEAIGGSMLLNLVLIFVTTIILLFIGILSYSKAYRVKNRIIEVIEKHEKYDMKVINELNADLKNVGYNASLPTKCDSIRENLIENKYNEETFSLFNLNNSGYDYCVFNSTNSENGNYYVVVTFIHFEFPIIGDVLTFPIYGETKMLNKDYNY